MLMVDQVVELLEELNVDEEAISAVSKALHEGADLIETSSFMTADPLRPTAFGGSNQGGLLGYHHDVARLVITETLDAFVGDLLGFAAGVKHAVDLVVDADETTRADLTTQREAVAILVSRSTFFDADSAEQQARKEHLGAGDRPVLPGGGEV